MTELEEMGLRAREAERTLSILKSGEKNEALRAIKEEIDLRRDEWLKANALDIREAQKNGMKESLLDRLTLNDERVTGIVKSIDEIIALKDPIGRVTEMETRPNGLKIGKKTVPLGVIGIIFEARPNVVVDASILTLKSGNACILRGGKEAINSNRAVVKIMRDALKKVGVAEDAISLIEDTSHETAEELMHLNAYLDVLIPRGGRNLIRRVAETASVPVIRTGEGVCHVYIDKDADLDMGAEILFNAKCQRPSVCNATECVLIHKDVEEAFLKKAVPLLNKKNTLFKCDDRSFDLVEGRKEAATEEDWDEEYGDYILAVKTVDDMDEAIDFIFKHGTGHSEAIITDNYERSQEFLDRVDAAAVYVNASTRFTDGGEFGLGAEIGISTQKLHARGPMGLKELTSYKYIIYGNGQVR